MKRYYCLVLSVFCFCHTAIAQYEGDQIFDDSYIHDIHITTDKSLDALFEVFLNEFTITDYSYSI